MMTPHTTHVSFIDILLFWHVLLHVSREELLSAGYLKGKEESLESLKGREVILKINFK